MFKNVNGELVDCTQQEIDEFNAREAAWGVEAPQRFNEQLTRDVTGLVESTAKARQYDNAATCASYANSTNEAWAAEANAFIDWRDSVWTATIAYQVEISGGASVPDDTSAFMATLPEMVWPS